MINNNLALDGNAALSADVAVAAVVGHTAKRGELDLVGHVKVALSAQIGTVDLTIEKLFSLKSGDVLSTNESLEAPVRLYLHGREIARGELVAVDDHFGVKILEVV